MQFLESEINTSRRNCNKFYCLSIHNSRGLNRYFPEGWECVSEKSILARKFYLMDQEETKPEEINESPVGLNPISDDIKFVSDSANA